MGWRAMNPNEEADRVLTALSAFGPILAIKLYRLTPTRDRQVPIIPCLDHEAMLHERIAPHAAAYLQDAASGDLHELVCVPAEQRIQIDTVSTWGEHSSASKDRLRAIVTERLPGYRLREHGPSWWRGERRVADACRAQVSLREVLLGHDGARVEAAIARLQIIAVLMEKQSRVASWGVRTVTGSLLAAAGVITFFVVGRLNTPLGEAGVAIIRYGVITALGAVFLYYGLKAVQLTEMSNRVWKRMAEYSLILSERKRLGH
jgi:hypothetical protein